jgi:T5SS/PEP-CTERM-associated repeat protein
LGEVTVDHLQWEIDGSLHVGGRPQFIGDPGGDGILTLQNGSLIASERGEIGTALGSIGEVFVSDSSWTVNVHLDVGSDGSGTLTVQDGGKVTSSSASILSDSTVIVDGIGSVLNVGSQIRMWQHPNSTLIVRNGGRVMVEDPMLAIRANSSSEITLDSGGVLEARGTIEMNTGTFNFLGGSLYVEAFDHHLVNQGGTLAPGNSDVPAGNTIVTGNYTHQAAATLEIEIGGTTAGTQHDFVNVDGTALIAGVLELTLIAGFAPEPDDEFTVFTTDTLLLGSFSNVADGQRLDTVDGLGSFLVRYGPTSTFNANHVVLSEFLPALPGDYNANGTVDAADYTVWRNTFGDTGAGLAADGNGNGQIDDGDYDVWKSHFGETAGSGGGGNQVAVPEPRAFVLALATVGVIHGIGRRTRKT